ncbi:FIST signal transduction protein [Flavobacterium gawalongense]|uniref:Histidine kinase n=1 Tax=Flavobacterium gawalongense TaxID=2594432 RepID=A0A553BRC0_9FLAO|nr:FIST N-terminal domain-containing protein [Flavobacterium gawalongense]TRX03407.1 histidine kinase [Flavobacterium gawalongense]TRX06825.1 histidine kinase [Flavobacterium gawalongense]TRX10755.1 histidine kinase [Flavobacterium gawalongense]TRX11478.1 histidine kinase [Flavobacterium gawalongense]TRX29247.1 histidine kinase [Flavobacterium gawalongense]
MKLQQIIINDKKKDKILFSSNGFNSRKANLVLAFGERVFLDDILPYKKIKDLYPEAHIVICSTSGQISNTNLVENNIVATAINFEKTAIKVSEIDIFKNSDIHELGNIIERDFFDKDLKSILILSEGSFINGTELINELVKQTKGAIPIFGGLAGDEYKFEKTIVGLNSDASQGKIVAVGFYGNAIHFGFSSKGGWSDFGPEREVMLSEKNVLYKIGDRFALDLYKEYLGKYAEELPGSSLYFPLSMKENKNAEPIVRTILSIDEEKKSMTFAGNIPQGSFVRLMKGNLDKIIDASYSAALQIFSKQSAKPELVLLVSCVGRKIVLGNRIEEELEVVKEVFGEDTLVCGFYSYGEISPTLKKVACELHNQTMTIATIYEEL